MARAPARYRERGRRNAVTCPRGADVAAPPAGHATARPRPARRREARPCRPDGTPLSSSELALLRILIDAVPDQVLLVTASHHVVAANAAFLRAFHVTAASACGSYCPRLVHGRETPVPECPLEASIASGQVTDSEIFDDGHGTWVRALISPTPLVDQRGEAVYLHLVGDITARKRLEALRGALLDQVISSQDAERRRIARELHDETLQALASLQLRLHRLAGDAGETAGRGPIGELLRLVGVTIDGVRRLARGLHPSLLDDLGLVAALERTVEDCRKLHGLELDLHVRGLDPARPLSRAVQLSLYRVVQEALNNVVRHAGATCASVVLDQKGGDMVLIVEDDGRGIGEQEARPGGASASPRGMGLVGTRERLSLLGGSLKIEARPEGGTTLYARIPVAGGAR
ncbi:MAG TPA: ATP-binding protein [Anaeromyxobacteraceae bacterium]|nr:ATP-binding protein [Anaeromyxobacteraceae bacterium]